MKVSTGRSAANAAWSIIIPKDEPIDGMTQLSGPACSTSMWTTSANSDNRMW